MDAAPPVSDDDSDYSPWDPDQIQTEKTKEGLFSMARAAHYLHTGLLEFQPDYDQAAMEYGNAALAFRRAKRLELAADAFLKEAEVHEKRKAIHYAGKAYEQAGLLLRKCGKLEEAAQAVNQAICWYVESGNADVTARSLRRFSQLLEGQIPYQVVRLYQRTSELFERDRRYMQALDFIGRASKLLVCFKRYGEAAVSLNKEKNLYQELDSFSTCRRRAVAQCLAYLRNSDFPAACKCVQETCRFRGFKNSREYKALVQLLRCYDDQDQEGLDKICTSPVFKLLEEHYKKMTKKLKVPGIDELRGRILPVPSTCMWPPYNEDKAVPITEEEEEEEEDDEDVEENVVGLSLACITC